MSGRWGQGSLVLPSVRFSNLKGGKGPEVVRMAEDSGELECNI